MQNVNMQRIVRSSNRSHSCNGSHHHKQCRLFLTAELFALLHLHVAGGLQYIFALLWKARYLNESTHTVDSAEVFAGEVAVMLSYRPRG